SAFGVGRDQRLRAGPIPYRVRGRAVVIRREYVREVERRRIPRPGPGQMPVAALIRPVPAVLAPGRRGRAGAPGGSEELLAVGRLCITLAGLVQRSQDDADLDLPRRGLDLPRIDDAVGISRQVELRDVVPAGVERRGPGGVEVDGLEWRGRGAV